MAENTRLVHATPEQVWAVLSDGWVYPLWVVGAARIRAVDDAWPAVGSRLHHSVGLWPLLLDDDTEVLETTPRSMTLRARAWPVGTARVVISWRPIGTGADTRTEVTINEDADQGPGTLVPKPLRTPLIAWRNTETLRRLAFLAEGRG